MPSEKILSMKQAAVAALKDKIANSVGGVLVDYKGINVADDTALRKELREAGVHYAVIKNSLLKQAMEGSDLSALENVLEGTTALALSDSDGIAPAKILQKFAEKHNSFSIKAGYMDGKPMSKEEVEEIAKLPSKEGLYSMLLSVLTADLRGLAVAVNAIAEKNGEDVA